MQAMAVDEGSWHVSACACDAEEQRRDLGVRLHEGEQECGGVCLQERKGGGAETPAHLEMQM